MVYAESAKRVLAQLAEALPEEGESPITGVDFWDGWGRAIFVRIHMSSSRLEAGRDLKPRVKEAVAGALGERRHRVEIVWDSAGLPVSPERGRERRN
jgi:hypothetical protein